MRIVVATVLVVASACATKKNPARCSDGVCIDPDRPYCDADGLIAGTADTCISADCDPLAFAACRGDVAITCNADSTDYEETQCPLGCSPEASGCRQCTANTQCTAAAPICDTATSHCRTCAADDECDSRVCDLAKGSCVPESSVVYAASQSGFGTCSKSQPCSLPTAVTAALNASNAPVLRMLPGTFEVPLSISIPNSNVLPIVATGATIAVIGDTPAINVIDGASVTIRGLTSTSERHIICGRSGAAMSTLSIDGAMFTSLGGLTRMEVTRCDLKIARSNLVLNGPSALLDDAKVEMDRVHISGNAINNLNLINAARVRLTISNSLLENVYINSFFPTDTSDPGTRIVLAYDTFVLGGPLETCKGQQVPFRTVLFENTIVASIGNTDAVEAANPQNCTFTSTIAYPQTTSAPVNAITMDPQFVNPTSRDFHLKATSPAIDAAMAGIIQPGPDLEGRARPVGAAPDLGAYESAP